MKKQNEVNETKIIRDYSNGMNFSSISEKYNISYTTLKMILNNQKNMKGGNNITFEKELKPYLKVWFDKELEFNDDFNSIPSLPLLEYPIFNNCHLGQRKLLLNEIMFYNRLPKDEEVIIIYSGSASGEHTPVILDLFPNFNFIMIDPNFHYMEYDYVMIYKDKSENLKDIRNISLVKRKLRYQKFANGDVANIINNKSKGKLSDFKGFIDSRVYVIQDYMTPDLAKKLNKMFPKCYHTSDIRTVTGNEKPSDIDYIANNALQILVIKELKPILSHLKFRTPNWNTSESIDLMDDEQKFYINECKQYGFNFLEDYKEKKYPYFDGEILVQPWAPPKSMESRLITNGEKIKQYTLEEYRGKFLYINSLRSVGYHPYYYEKVKHLKLDYDGCFDCAIEIKELLNIEPDLNRFKKLSKKIDILTRYNINRKCSCHGNLTGLQNSFTYGYEIDWKKNYKTIDNN